MWFSSLRSCLYLVLVVSLGCGRVDYDGGDGSGDAGMTDTGSADAGPPRTFCEQLGGDWGYNYCRDFDDTDEPFEFGWDRREIEDGGDMRADSNAYSAPTSLLATVADPGDGSCVNAYSEANVTGAIDHTGLFFRCEWDRWMTPRRSPEPSWDFV